MQTLSRPSLIAGLFVAVLGLNAVSAQPKAEEPESGIMQGQGTMPMMEMMRQMSEMMGACSKMMQVHAGEEAPDQEPSRPQDQQ